MDGCSCLPRVALPVLRGRLKGRLGLDPVLDLGILEHRVVHQERLGFTQSVGRLLLW